MPIDEDDPKLTAYALGELDEGERTEIEAYLADSPAARETVEDIRRTGNLLTRELQTEPGVFMTNDQRTAVEAKVGTWMRATPAVPRTRWSRPAAIAASLLLLVGVSASFVIPVLRDEYRPVSGPAMTIKADTAVPDLHSGGALAACTPAPSPAAPALSQVDAAKLQALGYVSAAPSSQTPMTENRHERFVITDALAFGDSVGSHEGANVVFQDRQAASRDSSWASADSLNRHRLSYGYGDPFSTERPRMVPPESGRICNALLDHQTAESYTATTDNSFLQVTQSPLSTFSIDVDTASYAIIRRFLTQGLWPPADAVRIEEMINYFSYDYALPQGDAPFSAHVEVGDCPWYAGHRLVRVALKGKELHRDERPPTNLVFLVDVSGSMQPPNKLPLLKQAMQMLVRQLGEHDRVAIVVYAGASGLVLPSTPCWNQDAIRGALERLSAGGSTNGGAGIQLAYDTAWSNFIEGGVNRVVLATDGDFNVGITNQDQLVRLIEEKAASGVFLSVLGFGMGNLKDSTLEKLADKGNGNYAYIDTIQEARKVLVEQIGGTLITIAKDVKIQIEFNPAQVAAYRLIGYENRLLAAEDFNDDAKDAGEIGAGHTVTALYELVPAGSEHPGPGVDPLKYQAPAPDTTQRTVPSDELLTLKLRYKDPDGQASKLLEFPVGDAARAWSHTSPDFRFAAAVAGFGMILRESPHKGDVTLNSVLEWAQEGLGRDSSAYRAEFIDLVQRARAIPPR